MKNVILGASALAMLSFGAQASEYSAAIENCKFAIAQEIAAPLTHNVLKGAERQGAHKVTLSFETYHQDASGQEVMQKINCLAAKQDGQVLDLAVKGTADGLAKK